MDKKRRHAVTAYGRSAGSRYPLFIPLSPSFVLAYLVVLLILTSFSSPSNARSSKTPHGQILSKSAQHNQRGLEYYKYKQSEEAIKEFQKALQLHPENVEAQNNLGFVYWTMKKYRDSADALLKTLALAPKRAIAYLHVGDLYVDMDKPGEAVDAYERFLELSPAAKNTPQLKNKSVDLRALVDGKVVKATATSAATFFKILSQGSRFLNTSRQI